MNTKQIANDVRYVRASDVLATDMDGDTVMMDIKNGSYFALSGSGPQIWDRLAEPIRIDELIAALREKFDTRNTDNFEQIVTDFVSGLVDKGLIRPAD